MHVHGITNIQTSSQAAEALRPVAGRFAFSVCTLGILGTGLLAVPVLTGSAAYDIGEAQKWPTGLARSISQRSDGATSEPKTLKQLGISNQESSEWQKLADFPDEEFEAAASDEDLDARP